MPKAPESRLSLCVRTPAFSTSAAAERRAPARLAAAGPAKARAVRALFEGRESQAGERELSGAARVRADAGERKQAVRRRDARAWGP